MNPKETLIYWIKERYEIFLKKEKGAPKPWSDDPVFQSTYFCNVHREDDKVTRFIRTMYNPYVGHSLFEYNIVLARFLNWPPTLARIGYQEEHKPQELNLQLRDLAKAGKIWGNAYVITTHGQRMEKVDYLTNQVLEAVFEAFRAVKIYRQYQGGGDSKRVLDALRSVDGIGDFLAGQVIADLKNTPKHPLFAMGDWITFVLPGPGSIRGCNWFVLGEQSDKDNFNLFFPQVREYVDEHWPEKVPIVCNQDLQNCLCEYDKYMRVKNGTGRSKRRYAGI